MRIRSYRPHDAEAVHRICVATGDAGKPAAGILRDPHLVAYVFADPYLLLQPELVFVAERDGAVLGYVVAALNSPEFYARWQLEWAPRFFTSHPASPDADARDADAQLRTLLHQPRRLLSADLDSYPSHLHINLLASARRQGAGRLLLEAVFDELARAGSPGVQLSVRASNTGAQAFYRAVGMNRLASRNGLAVRFGQPLGGVDHSVRENETPVRHGHG
ncbi:acetyltransferase (GNAT) family protein [Halopolyspora algeriensis]|uniref:Acetyltransferase (GNAT) family protein n=1 Tax=Halopolyspora algeriensis TaxID=1500506 RepID=A0A368VKH1_9ACTN|nr:GNAT family N-acetyltransferase [Halopolyspora algeriensis]RCW40787.1 acetyltransferase (GNAT) family protein [Halopolyspora algeriensis]TQM53295.1 acetyltransferase (GNAT) family protein [Halopolyspora algeriensis]